MDNIIEQLNEKVNKHDEKMKAHVDSEKVLRANYESSNQSGEKESIESKLLSTIKNIEYHKASSKTYNKVIKMLENN